MKSLKLLFIIISLFTLHLTTQAQGRRLGRVSKVDLQMKVYDQDTSAAAVILADIGQSYLSYQGPVLTSVFERRRRIKILKKEGYEWGNLEIPYRKGKGSTGDIIRGLKARVYTLVGNKVRSTRIDAEEFIDEKVDEYYRAKKIVFPNIKEGVIIEYSYRVISDLSYSLPAWYFQSEIPVKYSEFTVTIPQRYFDYVWLVQDKGLAKRLKINELTNDRFGRSVVSSLVNKWVAYFVPKFEKEKYMTAPSNHIAKIEFQLRRFMQRDFFSSWPDFDKGLLEASFFGGELASKDFGRPLLQRVAKQPLGIEKAKVLYQGLKNRIKYNGHESCFVKSTLKEAYEKGQGNAADVNLSLVNLLKRAGFQAFPVILSTRSHDQVNKLYPLIDKFNYVIALAIIDGKGYLLDATDKYMPFNQLPSRCLSSAGRIVAGYSLPNTWIPLNRGGQKYKENIVAELTLNEDGVFGGKIDATDEGYSALVERRWIAKRQQQGSKKKKTEEEANYEEDEKADLQGMKVLKAEIKHLKELEKPLQTKLEVNISDKVQKAGNMMYFNPMLYWQFKENPFKLKERKFPVDFGYHTDRKFYIKITIPKGYKVESLPKTTKLSLPGQDAMFSYDVRQFGEFILVNSHFTINRSVFMAKQYPALKTFFEKVITKHAEQIVLKKE
ncbi:hypothetical protein BKI52_37430 [marine bacterium AO1-C]|nr:hypothetical protein BKI52_37430 [marine bacterium AO1-C]